MRLGAVIVSYNPVISNLRLLLSNIVDSVARVIIVDNNSINSAEIDALAFDNVDTLCLQQNMGIGFAQNRGIELLLKDNTIDSVILFDQDSLPQPQMIHPLKTKYQELVEKGGKVAAVGPVCIDPRTQNKYPIAFISGFRLIKKLPEEGDNTPILASLLIASGCMIPRHVLEEVGLMEEELFIDYIDIEWCFRAQLYGYQLYACPTAIMEHRIGDDCIKAFGREIPIHSPLRRYYLARNSVLMIKRNYMGWKYKIRETLFSFFGVAVFLLFIDKKRTYLRYILHGWYDGLLGRVGPCKLTEK